MAAKYDGSVLAPGFYDLNQDGVMDTLAFMYKGKHALFISDDGKLPWDVEPEEGFDAYFQAAFRAGEKVNPWNEVRSNWGNYTFLVDRDGCGRFDSLGDFCYRAFDLNGDGAPEAEYYHLFPGADWCPYSNKFVVNFNGERDMSNIDFENLTYGDEQAYDEGFKYIMNVHGSGFFVNSYSLHPETSWETPIAWYDFDCDGKTNMVMRVGDTMHNNSIIGVGLKDGYDHYAGIATEFELAMELNGDTSDQNWHSLDMMLSFNNYKNPTLDYTGFRDHLDCMKPLKGSEPFYGNMLPTRTEALRQYLPYLDGVKIGLDHDNWDANWLIFDEDGDDCRWEEMFSNHEGDGGDSNYNTCLLSDHLGDRTEKDPDNSGKGLLYVSPMDGKIHLYKAKYGWWEIDYLALFKGSTDHPYVTEGPAPSEGMAYVRVRYFDNDNDGFLDTLRYESVEYGREDESAKLLREVSLKDLGIEVPKPELFDMRTEAEITGFRVQNWDGKPFTTETFEGSPAKTVYDKTKAFYVNVCENMWAGAQLLYACAVRHGLNIREKLDVDIKTDYTRDECISMKVYDVPDGYSRHLSGNNLREKYHNGYWLREKVFADICSCNKLDTKQLQRFYYAGKYQELVDYVDDVLNKCNSDEIKLEDLLGKTILIGLTYYTEEKEFVEQKQIWGTVIKSSEEGILVHLSNGEYYDLPPNLTSTQVATPGEYRLRSTGEIVVNPDYLTTWNVVKHSK